MQRLTDFQHHIIGCIHNAVDGAHPGKFQTALHPIRAWHGADIPHQPQHKAGIQIGIRDFDGNLPLQWRTGNREGVHRFAQRLAQCCRNFPRHAQHAGVANHIGQDGYFINCISQVIHQGGSGGSIRWQEHDSFMFLRDAKFFLGTNHRERFHPADLGALQGGQHQSFRMSVVNPGTLPGISNL